jgi:hypothetical protein
VFGVLRRLCMTDGDCEQVRQCFRCRGDVQGADSTSRSFAGDETIGKTWPRSSQAECSLRGGIGCIYPGLEKGNNRKPGPNELSVFWKLGTFIPSHSQKTTAPLKPTALATDKQGAVCQLAQRRQDVVRGDRYSVLTGREQLRAQCHGCVHATPSTRHGPSGQRVQATQSERRVSTCAR